MLRRRLYAEWVFVAIVCCLFVGSASNRGWFSAVDNRIYDLASSFAAPPVDERILLVEIDETSLRELGRWPWTRDVHAKALQTLSASRPAAIAYNVLFLESSPDDLMLREALVQARPVYLPAITQSDDTRLLTPPGPLATGASKLGVALLLADNDGTVRRAEHSLMVEGKKIDQMPTLLADAAMPAKTVRSVPDDRFLISFNPGHAFRRLSFASLTKGEVPTRSLKDKLVLVGVTAAGIGDFHAVPVTAGLQMSGLEIQANVLNTTLTSSTVTSPDPTIMAALALVPVLILLMAFLQFSPGRNFVLATGLAGGTMLLAVTMLPLARLWLPPSATILGLLVVHGFWGWRRLAAVNEFLRSQARLLTREHGILATNTNLRLHGDVITAEAVRLETIIKQVRQLRSFIARVIERFPDAVFVVDAQDQVVLCNDAARTLVGSANTAQTISTMITSFSPETATVGVPIRSYQGRTLLMARTPVDDQHHIVSFTDITELQRSANEREDLLQFLSHDLRAPNAAIIWLLEAEEMEPGILKQHPMSQSLRDQIKANARHGLRLADNFVQLVRARRRSLVLEHVDLCDVAREAADMVAAFARMRGIRLQNVSDTGELWVMGDQGMLLRAAINLLENAVKFAPEHAVVSFAVKQIDSEVIYQVVGPGPPMPDGRKEDPFCLYAEGRAAGSQSSIGLGLSFVHTSAMRHGGDASYLYHEGYGAEFRIKLPAAQLDD